MTSASLQHTGSAIKNDDFQKLPNRARQAAHSLLMRAVSRALLGATAVVRHGRAQLLRAVCNGAVRIAPRRLAFARPQRPSPARPQRPFLVVSLVDK